MGKKFTGYTVYEYIIQTPNFGKGRHTYMLQVQMRVEFECKLGVEHFASKNWAKLQYTWV